MSWSILALFRRAETALARHPEDVDRHVIDAAGWLHGPGVIRMPADPSWFGGPIEGGAPRAIVWHYTHTKPGSSKAMAKNRQRKRNPKTDRAASWQFTVDTDGTIVQMISAEDSAWHCAKGLIDGIRINACTVGIELVGDGTWFSPQQYEAVENLVWALIEAYAISRSNCARNHSEFDPTRRRDAGPVFNKHLVQILDRLFNKAVENAVTKVES